MRGDKRIPLLRPFGAPGSRVAAPMSVISAIERKAFTQAAFVLSPAPRSGRKPSAAQQKALLAALSP